MKHSVKERIFLVGCPRSGTTLLQSAIAAHSQILSFPESKFFHYLINPNSKRYQLMLPTKKARATLLQFLKEIDYSNQKPLSKLVIFVPQYVRYFLNVLDELTIQQGKNCWLEKTPLHIQRINCIEKFVPQAKFIHLVRNGADVVASLYEVSNLHPETWGKPRSIDCCIDRWINDVSISQQHLYKPNHLLVRYENVVANPQLELEKICNFLNVAFEAKMLSDRASTAQSLIRTREKWKTSVSSEIQNKQSQKFNTLFNEEQKQYIRDRVNTIDIESPLTLSSPTVTDCNVF